MTSSAKEFEGTFLVSKEKQKIVYMEAGKGFVDVLLGLLQLPIVSALSFFASSDAQNHLNAGSLTTLYNSLQKMNASSLLLLKDELLCPPCPPLLSKFWRLSAGLRPKPLSLPATVYKCSSYQCFASVSATHGGTCRNGHGATMVNAINLDNADPHFTTPSCGFVQTYLTFIISDDLNIMPSSTIESIIMLNKHGVKNLTDLCSVESRVSSEQVFELLRASFTSDTVLNKVFKDVIPSPLIDDKSK
ncbi:hypothetical protein KP509_28G049400 [Ceratopteris richardii]|uniref:Uncharacterized protein n=1 Tax=Ceratopteris richardii TaxID=49495 RepID=A0A8T2RDK9_CERRI|nr:hypothetical protein KP509_28G049400 [Ceratopteris richardii]